MERLELIMNLLQSGMTHEEAIQEADKCDEWVREFSFGVATCPDMPRDVRMRAAKTYEGCMNNDTLSSDRP